METDTVAKHNIKRVSRFVTNNHVNIAKGCRGLVRIAAKASGKCLVVAVDWVDIDSPGLVVVECPEACGVNVHETMLRVGVELEWPPVEGRPAGGVDRVAGRGEALTGGDACCSIRESIEGLAERRGVEPPRPVALSGF